MARAIFQPGQFAGLSGSPGDETGCMPPYPSSSYSEENAVTVSVMVPVLGTNAGSPEYTALMLWDPGVSDDVVKAAWLPAPRGSAELIEVDPSLKVIVPVGGAWPPGVPAPAVTCAENVTAVPTTAVLWLADEPMPVTDGFKTVSVYGEALVSDGPKLPSPA